MTKADFQALLSDWLNRSDLTTSKLEWFTQRGLARCQKELRLPCQETTASAAGDGTSGCIPSIPIPNDFLETLYVEADGRMLEPVQYQQLLRTPTAGCPRFFSRNLGSLLLRPVAHDYATLGYYRQFDPLVNDTDTNALLEVGPECLLFACLSYGGDFFKMDETTTWEARYGAERDLLHSLGDDADGGGGPQAVSPVYGGFYL